MLTVQRSGTSQAWVWQNVRTGTWRNPINYNIPDNQWSHTCIVQDGTVYSAYVNGTFIGSDVESPVFPNQSYTYNTLAAGNPRWPWPVFSGKVADVKVYRNVLTASDVANVFSWNSCTCCLPGMVRTGSICVCPGGTWTSNGQCITCSAGYYCPVMTTAPLACPVDNYLSLIHISEPTRPY